MANHLWVSEYFYSIQGEGPTAGHPAVFLRLKACNLLCPGWKSAPVKHPRANITSGCDTYLTWLKGTKMTFEQIWDAWKKSGWYSLFNCSRKTGIMLVITGGEPMLQSKNVSEFLSTWERVDHIHFPGHVEIETNGTIVPVWNEAHVWATQIQYNVSPKLESSGNEKDKRYVPQALRYYARFTRGDTLPENKRVTAFFKFVIQDPTNDLREINDMIGTFNINPQRVYLMPEGATREALHENLLKVAELAKSTGYKVSPRMHICIWDKTTGV